VRTLLQVVVGRLSANTLTVDDPEVSGTHLILRWLEPEDDSPCCWQVRASWHNKASCSVAKFFQSCCRFSRSLETLQRCGAVVQSTQMVPAGHAGSQQQCCDTLPSSSKRIGQHAGCVL